ncbi:MAG: ligase-associated DNA damage response exonuclease [Ginsengibacter sp.]
MNLISFTDKGLFCEQGGFYIDPWKPVERAIITHGHSDHAYFGHKHYLCHHFTKPILQLRLGNNNYESVGWNEPLLINGVTVTLFPAGHIIGSSQIKVEYKGEVWVVSGDYKTEDDGISGQFQPVRCNVFITESTFGLPIFKWKPQQVIYDQIINWIVKNKESGRNSVLLAYSLGKAQRVLKHIHETTESIYAHGAIYNTNETLRSAGWDLPVVKRITPDTAKNDLMKTVIIAPPGADGTSWMKRLLPYSVGVCSGWMQVRGNVRRKNVDGGFVMSDHADWDGLIQSVKLTGAEKVFVTHGFQSSFSKYITEEKIAIGAEVKTMYGDDEGDVQSKEEVVATNTENNE